MAFGTFHSVMTNNNLPAPGTGSPGDVWFVNQTGLLWFIEGTGNVIQLLQSVPIPTAGPQGPIGLTGVPGPVLTLVNKGNWVSNQEYSVGDVVTANNAIYYANTANLDSFPPSNPFWTLLGSTGATNTEIIVIVDGAGAAPSSGFKGFVSLPSDCILTGWTILTDQVGSASFDVKFSSFANAPTTVSITNGNGPQLVSSQKSSGNVSGWSPVTFSATDVLEVDLISCSGCSFITLGLNVTK